MIRKKSRSLSFWAGLMCFYLYSLLLSTPLFAGCSPACTNCSGACPAADGNGYYCVGNQTMRCTGVGCDDWYCGCHLSGYDGTAAAGWWHTEAVVSGNPKGCCVVSAWTPSTCPASCQQTRTTGCGGATTQTCTGGSCVPYVEVMRVKCPTGVVQSIAGTSYTTAANTAHVRKGDSNYNIVLVDTTDANASCMRIRIGGVVKAYRKM